MAKKQLSQQDYDQLIDSFALQLWDLRERWQGIKALMDTQKSFFTSVWTKYPRFFESVYRSFVYDFYVGICRLTIDDTKEAESMIKLLKKPAVNKPEILERADKLALEDQELVKQMQNNPTLKKIKSQRDNLLAHQNSNFLFNVKDADQFRKDNNSSANEIHLLLDTLDKILTKMATRATFYPLTAPNTSIGREIEGLFSILGKELSIDEESALQKYLLLA